MQRIARTAYRLFAWLFVAGVAAQVFLAGLVVVARVADWENHTDLGHGLGIPLLLMLVSMYLGKLPRSSKRLTWLLFGVYVLQADVLIFLDDSLPYAAALHPVLALVDFALGWRLARTGVPVESGSASAPAEAAASTTNMGVRS